MSRARALLIALGAYVPLFVVAYVLTSTHCWGPVSAQPYATWLQMMAGMLCYVGALPVYLNARHGEPFRVFISWYVVAAVVALLSLVSIPWMLSTIAGVAISELRHRRKARRESEVAP